MGKRWSVSTSFCRIEEMRKALDDFLKGIGKETEISYDCSQNLRLILTELSVNAIPHGKGQVSVIAAECFDGLLHILVSHESSDPFNPKQYYDAPPPLGSQNGRGIFLAKNLSENLVYNSNANKVLACVKTR
jgi:anti-sigma regulatory factor (Ser/Thr protein kinase)